MIDLGDRPDAEPGSFLRDYGLPHQQYWCRSAWRRHVEDEPTGHLLAVMAHSMLNSVAAIKAATSMLEQRERLNDRQTEAIIGVLGSQADHLHEMLKDLVRTGDPALMSTLDDLDRRSHYRIEDRGPHGPQF